LRQNDSGGAPTLKNFAPEETHGWQSVGFVRANRFTRYSLVKEHLPRRRKRRPESPRPSRVQQSYRRRSRMSAV